MAKWKQPPLAAMKERFGSKDKLVAEVVKLLGKDAAEDIEERLKGAANSKLLRLHDMLTEMNERFGSKEKMVDAILTAMKRVKDQDFREALLEKPIGRLFDMHRRVTKKSRKAA